MKLLLTNKSDSKQIIVDMDAIVLMEPAIDSGTHIVFSPDMGRVVAEDIATISSTIGVTVPKV